MSAAAWIALAVAAVLGFWMLGAYNRLVSLRNAVAALLRIEGWNTLPAGFRYCRESPQRSLKLLGIPAT